MITMEAPTKCYNVNFAWLEITPSCQLHCQHCYAGSMPGLGHGTLQASDWRRIIASLHALDTRFLQFIGGEATIHPAFCELVEFAGSLGFGIEVYSNLISITSRMWSLFERYKVRIATSFYSEDAAIHDAITGVVGSHTKTLANLKKALELGLTTRVGVVRVREDQNIGAVKALLTSIGVEEQRIGVDRARGVGRGASLIQESPVSALCGKCVTNRLAITSTGEVYPCIFSRSFSLGNVLQESIAEIVDAPRTHATISMLSTEFARRRDDDDDDDDPLNCDPECDPQAFPPCPPDCCPETVASCEPSE